MHEAKELFSFEFDEHGIIMEYSTIFENKILTIIEGPQSKAKKTQVAWHTTNNVSTKGQL